MRDLSQQNTFAARTTGGGHRRRWPPGRPHILPVFPIGPPPGSDTGGTPGRNWGPTGPPTRIPGVPTDPNRPHANRRALLAALLAQHRDALTNLGQLPPQLADLTSGVAQVGQYATNLGPYSPSMSQLITALTSGHYPRHH